MKKNKKIKTNISSAALLNARNVFLKCIFGGDDCDSSVAIINDTLSAGDAEPSTSTALDTIHLSYEMDDGIGCIYYVNDASELSLHKTHNNL